MDQYILNQIEEAKVTKKLTLFNVHEDSIWDKVLELKDLKTLSVHQSNVDYLLDNIYKLESLEGLDLSDNNIKKLPNNFNLLLNLKKINLSFNRELQINNKDLNFENILSIGLNETKSINFLYSIESYDETKLNDLLNDIKTFIFTGYNFDSYRNKDKSILIIGNNNNTCILTSYQKDHLLRINLFIIGDQNYQNDFLSKIKKIIDKYLYDKGSFFSSKNILNLFKKYNFIVYRHFSFYINSENYPYIDYEKLLSYYKSGENLYFDDSKGLKIPVKDLVDYIGINEEDLIETWEGSNYITSLEIKDFKLFNDISFNLSENINVILGRNALGKTSILQAITLGLLPLENEDKSNEFKELITFGKDKSEIILHWGNEYRKTYLFKNELNEEKYINIPPKLVLSYGANLNTDEKGIDLEPIISTLISGKDRIYHTKSIFLDYSTNFYDPISILERLYLDSSKNIKDSLIIETIDLIKSFINNYLDLVDGDEKILLEQSNSEFYFKDINNNKIKTRNLSEGFKDHILLITDIIIRVISSRNNLFKSDENILVDKSLLEKVSGVILIDEFDRHLHPIWQRKLLSRLKKDFPKIQFILTTHNIFSLQSAEGYKALILSTKENKVIVSEKEIEEGLSIDSIYNEYFGGNSNYFSFEIENLFTEFYLLLKKIKTNQITSEEEINFKNLIDELSSKSEEVQVIVSRELRQLERQTGKSY